MHLRSIGFLHDTFPTRDFYPFNLKVFQETDTIGFATPVTFFTGENGSGKSTLLRAIAHGCGIHIWEEHEGPCDRHNPYEGLLARSLRFDRGPGKVPGSFFASEIFRHFAEALDQWGRADPGCLSYFGDRSLVTKSHGQSHMAFFENRFMLDGLYLLDEPENALSPKRQLELLQLLRKYTKKGGVQFIIATHSPILLAYPGAEIWSFDTAPIARIGYEDTEYYRVYRDFLLEREKYLADL